MIFLYTFWLKKFIPRSEHEMGGWVSCFLGRSLSSSGTLILWVSYHAEHDSIIKTYAFCFGVTLLLNSRQLLYLVLKIGVSHSNPRATLGCTGSFATWCQFPKWCVPKSFQVFVLCTDFYNLDYKICDSRILWLFKWYIMGPWVNLMVMGIEKERSKWFLYQKYNL